MKKIIAMILIMLMIIPTFASADPGHGDPIDFEETEEGIVFEENDIKYVVQKHNDASKCKKHDSGFYLVKQNDNQYWLICKECGHHVTHCTVSEIIVPPIINDNPDEELPSTEDNDNEQQEDEITDNEHTDDEVTNDEHENKEPTEEEKPPVEDHHKHHKITNCTCNCTKEMCKNNCKCKIESYWFFEKETKLYVCHNCGNDALEMNNELYLSEYCPFCGAHMLAVID